MMESTQRSLLLVEDEALIAMATKSSLERYGYTVSTTQSGEAAIEAARSGAPFELVLMDIDLGTGIDGTEAAAVILSEHDIPVVFLSSHIEPEVVAKTEKITSYGYVVKSSNITVLDASIKMALKLFEAQKRRGESEKRFQDLFENMNDAFALHEVIFDAAAAGNAVDYRFVEVNCEFANRAGMLREQLLGRTARELFPNTEQSWIDAFGRVAYTGVAEQFSEYSVELDRYFETRLYSPQPGFCAGLFSDVTDRRRIEDENRVLADVIRRSNDFIGLANLETKAFFVNPAGRAMVGLEGEEAVRTTEILDYFMPEDREFVENTVLASVMKNGRWAGEFRFRHFQTNLPIPVYYDLFLTENPATGKVTNLTTITRDMSERKRVEQALLEREAQFRNLFESAPDAVFIADIESGLILSANSAAAAITGRAVAELVGMHHNDLHPPTHQEYSEETFSHHVRLPSEKSLESQIESEIIRSDGKIIPVEITASQVMYEGRNCLMGIFRDISERRKSEQQIRGLVAEKENLLKEAQHRVKNVMSTMSAMLSLQAGSTDEPSVFTALTDAATRFRSVELLYDRLHRDEAHRQGSLAAYLTRLVAGVVEFFGVFPALKVETEIVDINLPDKTLSAVGLIVNELITNAMKYAFAHRENGHLSVRAELLDGQVVISVQDDGPGLPINQDPQSSSGFGLSMVQTFAEQLRGTVAFEQNGGTTVRVMFPQD